MLMVRRMFTAGALLVPVLAWGQGGQCAGGRGTRVPDLGFADVSCNNCTINVTPRRTIYRFGTEPWIEEVTEVGEGKLREGDALVAVDGRLITTTDATDRIATVRRGQRVRLTVRRNGGTRDVEVIAGERCLEPPTPPTPPTPPAAPRPPRAPAAPQAPRAPLPPTPPAPGRAPRAPQAPTPPLPPLPQEAPLAPQPPLPPTPPEILPEGWFGFGISCDHCGLHRRNGDVTMYFGEPPEVESVEPGSPAARAGIRRGDLLTHVDGLALTTTAGARRFAGIRPGQSVAWTYRRGGQAISTRATALRRPDLPTPRPNASLAPTPAASRQLRYSGAVGSSNVEVRGVPVTITRDERTGEMVIRSHDLTVRIRPERP